MGDLFNVGAFDLEQVLDEQYMDKDEFTMFYKPRMDLTISSVGASCSGAMNMTALRDFVAKYLANEETAKDFLRIKGVFNIAGQDTVFVMQCVHMTTNQGFARAWREDEARENRILFIGRGMQKRREELMQGFLGCVARPLRFAVGAKVEAKVEEGEQGFRQGIVVKHWDDCHAYRIRLGDDGPAKFVQVWTAEGIEHIKASGDYDMMGLTSQMYGEAMAELESIVTLNHKLMFVDTDMVTNGWWKEAKKVTEVWASLDDDTFIREVARDVSTTP